jgi:hypothetical protein
MSSCGILGSITMRPTNVFMFMSGLFWAIDGTHVTARVPKRKTHAYREESTTPVIVDFDMKFTYVLAGWG